MDRYIFHLVEAHFMDINLRSKGDTYSARKSTLFEAGIGPYFLPNLIFYHGVAVCRQYVSSPSAFHLRQTCRSQNPGLLKTGYPVFWSPQYLKASSGAGLDFHLLADFNTADRYYFTLFSKYRQKIPDDFGNMPVYEEFF